jgi:hypothetical protein
VFFAILFALENLTPSEASDVSQPVTNDYDVDDGANEL